VDSIAFEPLVGPPKDALPLWEQRITLLENEVRMLHGRLGRAYGRIAELEGRDPQLALDELIAELAKAEAERLRKEQEEAAAAAQADEEKEQKKKGKKKKPRRGHGPRPQEALDVVEEIIEFAGDEPCKVCGGKLKPLGDQCEESEEISVFERRYVKKVIRRRKYRCRCNACVMTAPAPPRVIPGGRYSLDFIAQLVADKWLDHVPLERQAKIMARSGLEISSQTLFDQALALSRILRPVYDGLDARVLEAPLIHADETGWPRLDSKKASNWTVWTRTTPDIAHYAILSSKSRKAADELFSGYRGLIVADGYQVYECLARDGPELFLVNCWAHVRRKFEEISENFPKPCAEILAKIKRLYKVEKEVEGPFPGTAAAQRERARLRDEKSRKIIDEIWGWACIQAGLPNSGFGKAMRYMLKRWAALTRFLDDPQVPLDNNAAERSLRGPVVGRKVHYGSKSKRGTEVAAIFYTLFETAKLCGVEPVSYLRAATRHALENPGSALVPHDFRPSED
jgi:transposase